MRLDHADGRGVDIRDGQGRAEDGNLSITGRRQNIVGSAVLVGGGTANDGQHPVAVALRVIESLEHDDAAALGAHEAIRLDVEGMAAAGRRQHSLTGGRGIEARVEHQHDATGEGHIALAVVQAPAGLMYRNHARRAGGVHGQCGAVQAEGVCHPARRHAERIPGKRIGLIEGAGVAGDHGVVVVRHTDEHTRGRTGDRRRRAAGLFDCLPAGLQQHAMLRIHRGGLALVDPEKVRVEAGDVIDECAPLRHRPALHTGLRIVEFVSVPAFGRNLGDHVVAAQQGFPQPVGGIDTARESAGHTDNGDWG